MVVAPERLITALDAWLLLERPNPALPDVELMRQDLRRPIAESLHGGKTYGHLSRAVLLTRSGIANSGEDGAVLLARAASVWGKLISGYVIRPRYLLSADQQEFDRSIVAVACDVADVSKLNIARRVLSEPPNSFEEQITHATQEADSAMLALRQAALSDSYDGIIEACTPVQERLYCLALGCVALQLTRTDGNQEACGIMEPGHDAEAKAILNVRTLNQLGAT